MNRMYQVFNIFIFLIFLNFKIQSPDLECKKNLICVRPRDHRDSACHGDVSLKNNEEKS